MPLNGMSLLVGATSATATGGTATTFEPNGTEVPHGIHVVDTAETDFRIQKYGVFTNRSPKLVNGVYTKAKRHARIVQPKILSDGSTTLNIVRAELEVHPETTVAELDDLVLLGAQLYIDADTKSYWRTGNLT